MKLVGMLKVPFIVEVDDKLSDEERVHAAVEKIMASVVIDPKMIDTRREVELNLDDALDDNAH